MIDDPDVWLNFTKLWNTSASQGTERGGWIVADAGGYRFEWFRSAEYTPCGVDIYESPPPGAVSILHTHPWPLGQPDPCGGFNSGIPSDADVAALVTHGFTIGYILDANGISTYTPSAPQSAMRASRCGY